MKTNTIFTLLFTAMVLFSSCGIITKTRYGNGLKLNLGGGVQKEHGTFKASTAKGKTGNSIAVQPAAGKDTVLRTSESARKEQPATMGVAQSPETKSVKKSPEVSNKKYEKRLAKMQRIKPVPSKKLSPRAQNALAPMEPNVKIAGILFYGGALLSILLRSMTFAAETAAALSIISTLAILLGFILAWVGLSRIKESGGSYGGRGLAISIIVLFILYVIFVLFVVLLLIAILGGF